MTQIPARSDTDAVAAAPSRGLTAPRRRRRRVSLERVVFFAIFLGLPLTVYLMFVVSPFLQSFYYSMTDWTGLTPSMKFVGFENYDRVLHNPVFWKALRNNLALLVLLPLVTIALSFALAIMVTIGGSSQGGVRGIRGSAVYRVVSFFPYAIPAVIVGILFNFVYHPSGGLLNGALNVLLKPFGITVTTAWLGDPKVALLSVAAAIIWAFVGFYMVLFVASISSIPSEVLEAARLDGAGRLRIALQIVAPMVRDSISTALVYMGILALDAFTFLSVMTPNGGTDNSTRVVSQLLYQTGFSQGRFGEANAMGVIMAIVTMLVAVVVLWLGRSRKETRR
ncbi:carbohydrate ABC transporter permease [Brachybacterium huguangmaarense]